jgi:hypothetical protein
MFSPQVANGALSEIYVIDTLTGRVWRRMFFNDIKGFYLCPQPYLTADQATASATPPEGVPLESTLLQKNLEREIQTAQQKVKEKEPDKQ